jgi:Ca2+:H+ antiporter
MLVGDAAEQLGKRVGSGATGILQSALGNLTELLVCIFALRAGLALTGLYCLIAAAFWWRNMRF